MSETPTTPTLPAPALANAQAAYVETLTELARINQALELTRAELAQLEEHRDNATKRAAAHRAELYAAVAADVAGEVVTAKATA